MNWSEAKQIELHVYWTRQLKEGFGNHSVVCLSLWSHSTVSEFEESFPKQSFFKVGCSFYRISIYVEWNGGIFLPILQMHKFMHACMLQLQCLVIA